MAEAKYKPRASRPRRAVKRIVRNGRYRFRFPLQTEAALAAFVKAAFSVTFPDKVVCPGHSTPWRAFCDAYFARHPVIVIKASRGFGGKSFLMATLAATEAITLAADVNILGGSGEQSKNVLSALQKLLFLDLRRKTASDGAIGGQSQNERHGGTVELELLHNGPF